jgi:hypothetical protein
VRPDHGLVGMTGLPAKPVAAAAFFYQRILPQVELIKDGDVTILFPTVDSAHEGWMRAAVQDLAREAAPRRVNAVVGDDDAAIQSAIDWLDQAPGITGQLLAVDGNPAGNPAQ